MSEDGKDWYPASYCRIEFQCKKQFISLPTKSYQEERPSGFSVVRNGQNIGTTTDLNFTDRLTEAGTYTCILGDFGLLRCPRSLPSTSVEAKIINLGTPIAPAQVTAYLRLNSQTGTPLVVALGDTPEIPVDLTTPLPEYRLRVNRNLSANSVVRDSVRNGHSLRLQVHLHYRSYSPRYYNRYTLQGVFDESFKVTDQTENGFP